MQLAAGGIRQILKLMRKNRVNSIQRQLKQAQSKGRQLWRGISAAILKHPSRNLQASRAGNDPKGFRLFNSRFIQEWLESTERLFRPQVRLAELRINVKQNAHRRIPPGRDPGGRGTW